jgi:hypothetical protein
VPRVPQQVVVDGYDFRAPEVPVQVFAEHAPERWLAVVMREPGDQVDCRLAI